MPQVVTKLFKRPDDAEKALAKLHEKKIAVSIVASDHGSSKAFVAKHLSKSTKLGLPSGNLHVSGPAAATVESKKDNIPAAMSEALGVSADGMDYYQIGVSLGGIILSVAAEGDSAAEARKIMRAASGISKPAPTLATSPGFAEDGRMASSNPMDAAMSGDFRKY